MGILMEGVGGGLDAWTVGAPVPPLAARAGLQHGDVIVSVNGVGPEAGAAALGVISAPAFELSVRRANGESVAISIETGA
jgi:C-terminal processing protease CtpA/Prc